MIRTEKKPEGEQTVLGRPAWWKESVVYQVYWRSFADTNGDGVGDLRGVIGKLDYIKSLGVDFIWLNPFNASPGVDNGYDISDYYAIAPEAGTMADFDELVAEAHRRGLKIMMDIVLNHTSDRHPWFLASRSSKGDPKRDWYIWRDPAPDGGPPTNWRSYFHPSCWRFDEATGQYYMHSFAIGQPDLNWANPEVRREMYRMLRYWLDRGVDGLRLDALALLAKPAEFRNAADPYDIRYLTHNPGLHDYLQEMHREVFRHYDIMTVGEVAFATPELGVLFVDEEREELHSLFHFEVADEMPSWDLPRFRRIQRRWADALRGRGVMGQFLNNHDHTRQVSRYGNDREYRVQSAKLLATMVHTLPGIPYVYQGEELGMTGVRFDSIDDYRDVMMKARYEEEIGRGRDPEEVLRELQPLSRDNSRTPMQWNAGRNAGFTDGEPWIRPNPNHAEINVEAAEADPDSVLHYYRKLIAMRKANPVMVYGDFEDIGGDDPHVYAYVRKLGDTAWIVVLNHSDDPGAFALPEPYAGRTLGLVLGNYPDADRQAQSGTIRLRPHEALILSCRV
jgi:oligo-1,6-glucosidase